eukprot:Gb_32414 [translate_table: standard]
MKQEQVYLFALVACFEKLACNWLNAIKLKLVDIEDCIGSAFNAKGAMQCPNCRHVENGQWLYANGCRPYEEFTVEDWANDEDLYDVNYTEMGHVKNLNFNSQLAFLTFSSTSKASFELIGISLYHFYNSPTFVRFSWEEGSPKGSMESKNIGTRLVTRTNDRVHPIDRLCIFVNLLIGVHHVETLVEIAIAMIPLVMLKTGNY